MTSVSARELDYRPSYLAAAITAGAVFGLYLATLGPSTAMWDTSEYIAAACTLSLPHPPGNPLFVLLGRVACALGGPMTAAMRINILAALCSAVAAGFWFLVTERVLVSWLAERWQRIVGGVLAAIVGASAFTVWNQSVVNEKVYTISLVGLALVSWLTVRWCDDPDGPKADRILVLIAYLLGLGYANHMAGILAAPAVGIAVLARRPRTLLRWRLMVAAAAALLLGTTPFATQPIRAALHPPLNTGEVTACQNGLELSCTLSGETYRRFMDNFNREQYPKPGLIDRQAPFPAQVGMWWLYFKWQWLRDVHGRFPLVQSALAVLFLALGLLGGYVHWRRDRRSFWYFGPLVFTLTLGLIYFLNFKYGYSQWIALGQPDAEHEVRDRDYFYLWSFSAWSVWVGLGLVFVWEWLAARFGADRVRLGRETVEQPRRRSWLLASPALALALLPLIGNWKAASRAGETFTADFARDMLNSVEPYGILVTGGDNDTFPLWYAQEVEGVRKDVVVAVTSLLNTDWYLRQIQRRPVYEYDAAKGPAPYRGRQWRKPSGPPLKITLAEADAIPPYLEIREPQLFRKDSIVATIKPGYLTRDQLIVLQFIKDSFPERPVYFSKGGGLYGEQLGLGEYLLTQGLARRLLPHRPAMPKDSTRADTVLIQGEGWFDLPRTDTLWHGTFAGYRSIIRRGDWVDRASISIPYLYLSTGALLAEAWRQRGDSARAASVMGTVVQLARASRLEQLLAGESR